VPSQSHKFSQNTLHPAERLTAMQQPDKHFAFAVVQKHDILVHVIRDVTTESNCFKSFFGIEWLIFDLAQSAVTAYWQI